MNNDDGILEKQNRTLPLTSEMVHQTRGGTVIFVKICLDNGIMVPQQGEQTQYQNGGIVTQKEIITKVKPPVVSATKRVRKRRVIVTPRMSLNEEGEDHCCNCKKKIIKLTKDKEDMETRP